MSVFDLTERAAGRAPRAASPRWRDVPRTLEDLSGGLTNRNVKVTTPDGVFVARFSDANAEDLDIDREAEAANSQAAAEAGVGAPVFESRPDLGLLVIGYIDGTTLSDEAFRADGFLPRAAAAIRQLHEGPRFVNDFDMFARQRRYRERCRSSGFRIAEGYDDHADAFADIQKALAVLDAGHGAVQQRPPGRELHRRRREGLADRLRLLGQQRPVLRARQRLGRVPARPGAPRRARDGLLR